MVIDRSLNKKETAIINQFFFSINNLKKLIRNHWNKENLEKPIPHETRKKKPQKRTSRLDLYVY
jgi:hypothetical protein